MRSASFIGSHSSPGIRPPSYGRSDDRLCDKTSLAYCRWCDLRIAVIVQQEMAEVLAIGGEILRGSHRAERVEVVWYGARYRRYCCRCRPNAFLREGARSRWRRRDHSFESRHLAESERLADKKRARGKSRLPGIVRYPRQSGRCDQATNRRVL